MVTVQIQISWLLKKPTDLDLLCLQRQDIFGFSMTRVKAKICIEGKLFWVLAFCTCLTTSFSTVQRTLNFTCGWGLPMYIFLPFCELRILCNNNCCSNLSRLSCLCNSNVAPNVLRFGAVSEWESSNRPNVALKSFERHFGTWINVWTFNTFTLHRIPDSWKQMMSEL